MRASIQAGIVLIKERLSELEHQHIELKSGINYWNSPEPKKDEADRKFYKRYYRNRMSANLMRRKHWQQVLADHRALLQLEHSVEEEA